MKFGGSAMPNVFVGRLDAHYVGRVGAGAKELVGVTSGPIEFARAENVDDLGSTEYGGDPGLIAGAPNNTGAGLSGRAVDHLAHLTTSERLQVLKRTKSHATEVVEVDEDGATTVTVGVVSDGIDPVTGLTVQDADADDAGPGVPATDFVGGPNA